MGTDTGANTCSGALDPNYSFTYVAGNMTITPPPQITSLSVSQGGPGTQFVINGSGFGSAQGTGTVTVNGASVPTIPAGNWTATQITVQVPTGASSGSVVVTVVGVPSNGVLFTVTVSSSISLATSLTPSTYGSSVTFTATVTGNSPTGTVTFYDFNGAVTLATNVQLNSGTATLTISTLSPGSHSITAAYSGDANNLSSTSAVFTQTVKRNTMNLPWYYGQ